jgi:hypothetical protein
MIRWPCLDARGRVGRSCRAPWAVGRPGPARGYPQPRVEGRRIPSEATAQGVTSDTVRDLGGSYAGFCPSGARAQDSPESSIHPAEWWRIIGAIIMESESRRFEPCPARKLGFVL